MRILLAAVNAKYIHSNLAVYSLKASAGPYEPVVELAEYTINHRTEDIFRMVYQKKPQLLFWSCYIWNRQVILELTADLRRVLPETVIWVGGPEVSYDAEQFLTENPQFDGVMTGEGETTFRLLLQHYVDGEGRLDEIPGIVYRETEQARIRLTVPAVPSPFRKEAEKNAPVRAIRSTVPVAPSQSLDGLPFVYTRPEEFANRIIYYESSRGCPFSCSYCLSSIDKRVRFRSLELVKRELAFFLEHRVPQVKFVDRTFNCSHHHAMEIWRWILEKDNGVTNFHFEIAADILDEEELELLSRMRPGLVQLEIGVQTVNGRTLEAICRTGSFARIADRVRHIAAAGNIHQHLDLIAGLPYEDFASFADSFDAVYRLHPQELQLGFLKVLKGSEMHRRAEEYGIVYRSVPPYEVLATRWISCDELLRLKEIEEMLEVFYNSQQFGYTMAALERLYERPFQMYADLADFYKKKCPEGQSWSRMQRFVFLREFIEEYLPMIPNSGFREVPAAEAAHSGQAPADWRAMQQPYFDQLLILDCYLRENAKSRPAWAVDPGVWKARTADFYRREEQRHRYLPDRGLNWKQMMRSTHLEHFDYDVQGDGRRCGRWLLFDYELRSPVTGDAMVTDVTEDMENL